MELLALTIFAKSSIADVGLGSKYAFAIETITKNKILNVNPALCENEIFRA